MKILLLGFAKMKFMPYMNFYLDNIDTATHETHILYWNRDGKEDVVPCDGNVILHEYTCAQEDQVPKFQKLKSFYGYYRYVKKLLKEQAFDRVVVMHTLPGILLHGVLTRQYTNRYIFDYRDSTYERFKPFKKRVGNVVRRSYATFVSSGGFIRFLPQECRDKIYISHNLLMDSLEHRGDVMPAHSERIRLAFWGFIRDESLNKQLIERIAADDRFELHYYGREQQVALSLKAHAAAQNATNIYFHGEYQATDRYTFARNTDLIHNLYDDANAMLAMGNKYYDGVVFRLPQLCIPTSFMGDKAIKSGVGLVCTPYDDDFCDKVYAYYHSYDREAFSKACDAELESILQEYQHGCDTIRRAFGDA